MNPNTIDRARADFYKYANQICEDTATTIHSTEHRRRQVRALIWLYFRVKRLENHLYVHDRQALQILAFETVKEARKAFKSLKPRNPLEAAFIKALLKLDLVTDINKIAPTLEAFEGLRQDADRVGVTSHNIKVGVDGGAPRTPLGDLLRKLYSQEPNITGSELWDRVCDRVGGGVVVEAYRSEGLIQVYKHYPTLDKRTSQEEVEDRRSVKAVNKKAVSTALSRLKNNSLKKKI